MGEPNTCKRCGKPVYAATGSGGKPVWLHTDPTGTAHKVASPSAGSDPDRKLGKDEGMGNIDRSNESPPPPSTDEQPVPPKRQHALHRRLG